MQVVEHDGAAQEGVDPGQGELDRRHRHHERDQDIDQRLAHELEQEIAAARAHDLAHPDLDRPAGRARCHKRHEVDGGDQDNESADGGDAGVHTPIPPLAKHIAGVVGLEVNVLQRDQPIELGRGRAGRAARVVAHVEGAQPLPDLVRRDAGLQPHIGQERDVER